MNRTPVILYELNEVPWRVFDWYTQQRPQSNLASLLKNSATYTTRTHDEGELHPWSTWPTLHRGVYNTTHKIHFINQDKHAAAEYPPLWEVLQKKGVAVGVFGSMQSWPAPKDTRYHFYIPDTFAQTPETFPLRYTPFQSFNLRQTKADGAVAQPLELNSSVVMDLVKLPFIGVRLRTFYQLAKHLFNERRNPLFRTRRSLMQAPLAFDIFLHAYKSNPPQFCTFFTNHVAGVMHRYWKYSFPEDFNYQPANESDYFKRESLLTAMDIADSQVGELLALLNKSNGQLIIASSMGQEAIERGEYAGELRLKYPERLMQAIGFDRPFKDMLAMQPDFNFEFTSENDAARFIQLADRLQTPSGKSLWIRTRQAGNTVNMGMTSPEDAIKKGYLVFLEPDTGNKVQFSLEQLGIITFERDHGTGYHQPLGCVIWHGSKKYTENKRAEIELTKVKDMILDIFSGSGSCPA